MNVLLAQQLHKLAMWFRLYNGMLPEARENCACVLEDAAKALEIPCFNYKECEIMGDGPVQLWFVQGIENVWYPTKIVAEQAARIRYPEDPNGGYGRIYYRHFHEEA